MQEFNVYPKEGEKFSVEFQRFEVKENGFVLYDDRNEPSKEGYLSFENVAAIIPIINQRSRWFAFSYT